MYLKHDEFLPYAPDSVGKIRINHESDSCHGGRDSMIISRKPDGSVNAYCFRCGGKGWSGSDTIDPYKHRQVIEERVSLVLPDDLIDVHDCDNVEAIMYVHNAGLYDIAPSHWSFYYSETANRVYVINAKDDNVWLARSLEKKPSRKWIENLGNKYDTCMFTNNIDPALDDDLFIVEDIISALSLNRLGYKVLCLYGSEFTARHRLLIDKADVHNVYVWMDNDTTSIKLKQANIKESLSMLKDTDIEICKTEHDPKHYAAMALRYDKGDIYIKSSCLLPAPITTPMPVALAKAKVMAFPSTGGTSI